MLAKGKAAWLVLALALLTSSPALASIPTPGNPLQPAFNDRIALFEPPNSVSETPAPDVCTLPETVDRSIDLNLRHAIASAMAASVPPASLPKTRVWGSELHRPLFHQETSGLTRSLRLASAVVWRGIASGRTVLSPDPLGYRDSSNLYAFAGGDPVNGRDPLGLGDHLGGIFTETWSLNLEAIDYYATESGQWVSNKIDSIKDPRLRAEARSALALPVSAVLGQVARAHPVGFAIGAMVGVSRCQQQAIAAHSTDASVSLRLSFVAIEECVGFGTFSRAAFGRDLYSGEKVSDEQQQEAQGYSIAAPAHMLLFFGAPNETAAPWPTVSQTPQVLLNKAAGDAWEASVVRNVLPATQENIETQLTIRSFGPSRMKVRLDAAGEEVLTGDLRLTDAKGSATAPLTGNQTVVYPEIEVYGGVVAGKGKGMFPGGTRIPPTKVDIIRKP